MTSGDWWHTSDWHLGHYNCNVKWRGFKTVEAHNSYILHRTRDLLGEDARLINHGDTGMRSIAARLALYFSVRAEQTLLLGNHDELHPCNKEHVREEKRRDRWEAVFGGGIHAHTSIEIAGRRVLLSHFPYAGGGDHTATERFTEWRLKDEGEWLLCGHSHHSWLINGRMINVGVDQWGWGPVPRDILSGIIDLAEHGAPVEQIEAYRDAWVQLTGGRLPSPWPRPEVVA